MHFLAVHLQSALIKPATTSSATQSGVFRQMVIQGIADGTLFDAADSASNAQQRALSEGRNSVVAEMLRQSVADGAAISESSTQRRKSGYIVLNE
jgi:hypothetical protein